MQIERIQGMAVEDTQNGHPSVICVHGLGGTSNTWSAMLSAFEGHRLIRVDLPGCGRAPPLKGEVSVQGLVANLVALCENKSIEQAHWVAHSMGTVLCQHLAALHPRLIKSLVLFGPIVVPSEQARSGLRSRAQAVEDAGDLGMQSVADQLLKTAISPHSRTHSPVSLAYVRESLMQQSPKAYAAHCLALAQAQAAPIEQIRVPSLLVTGDEDQVSTPDGVRAMGRRMPRSQSIVLSRCGHWTPIEKPHDCARETRQFLKRHS